MTQSEPSRTALATSETSARVGRGFLVIDSSICVAQMTGFPARLHLAIIIFCAMKTFSGGISIPRSPRATMTPSVSSRISSKLRTPSWFSILEIILMLLPASPRHSRTSSTSAFLRMNEAKTMSTPFSTPNWRSLRSLGESAGSDTGTSGRLTPFFDPSMPVLMTVHLRVSPLMAVTVSVMRPSSMYIRPPTDMSFGRSA
mmetsp:Transcript_13131/g.33535  ORF Transcript_13131/g.33535 Transcript_13131/m.33535 type:complete len:200 (-) Transcript_13131:596-1195(-)